jgi:hypothetical protein
MLLLFILILEEPAELPAVRTSDRLETALMGRTEVKIEEYSFGV